MHTPVLLQESIDALHIHPDGIYIDATLGYGGHSTVIAKKLSNRGHLHAIEGDKDTYEQVKHHFVSNKNVSIHHRHFVDALEFLVPRYFSQVDGILFDLGTNIVQIRDSGKGLSFGQDAPLDMRLFPGWGEAAADILAYYSEDDLTTLFRQAGESFARPIARRIVAQRKVRPIRTTFELNAIIEQVKQRRSRIHPATQVYMALRIEANKEYDAILKAIPLAIDLLKPGGRIAVITFHSTEDALVKKLFLDYEARKVIKRVNKKVIKPSRTEIVANPPSRSAKLRIIEKI